MRLADLGADVLKIEPPGVGEWTRTHGFAGAELEGETTAVLGTNRNKRSVTVNLKSAAGREVFYDLVRDSDVFLQNFRVGNR
jgi:crotonobetainyl-CoA:carnitine CoA-transferase CaiB-like acyl-CoA transferase